MNEKKKRRRMTLPMVASIGATILVLVLFFSYLFSSGLLHKRNIGIELTDGEDGAPVISSGSKTLTAQSVYEVEIGTDNARAVIASLSRPADYSCRVENRLYYTGGESVLYCRRYAKGSAVRTDTVNEAGAVQSTILRAGSLVYGWNAGDANFYKGVWGDFTDDAAAMLPTYEDALDESAVYTAAGKLDLEGEPCIFVEFEKDGYRCRYSISAVSGLLKAASFYQGDMLARQVTVLELSTETPADKLFELPSGASVLGD